MTDRDKRIHGYCGLCIARCGTIAVVEDERLVRLEPDPSHPTGQALCAKGRAAPELVYSRERLMYPMRRTRPKGDDDPGWQRIGWDEALDLTAAAMRRIAEDSGPEAVCFSMSSPSTTAIGDAAPFIRRLMNAFGTPNSVSNLDLCGWGRAGATRYTYGVAGVATGGGGGAMADIGNSGCLILWGYNPSYSRLTHATATMAALKRGMKLIVIDPRHVGLANKADVWLRVRPGTDGALALGLANLMIEHGWYDRDFIRTWSNGPMLVRSDTGRVLELAWDTIANRAVGSDGDPRNFALEGEYVVDGVVCHPVFELYTRLCSRYSPEHVEATCWVPRAQLHETARLIWQARPVSYYAWSGHEQQANVTQTARAMSLFYALTGCFDAQGGNVLLPVPASASITGEDLPAVKRMAPVLGLAERPLGPALSGNVTTRELYQAIIEGKPYPVRGLLGFGSNMLLAHADSAHGREALAKLDFYAHCDMFMTPTAELADVVLPVASCFERDALKFGFEISAEAQSLIQYRQPVVQPLGETRPDTRIVFDLADRLGLGKQFWEGDIAAAYRQQLAPSGVTLDDLSGSPQGVRVPLHTRYRKYQQTGFATPSRKVELYSQTFLDHGQAPLPDFDALPMEPTDRFPLVLTCAKPAVFCQTQHRALPSLRKHAPYPEIDLHPLVAAERGIADGDWVSIETSDGSVRARARFNARLDPRVVVGEHGWWQACTELDAPGYNPFGPDGANYNLLIGPAALDPISGTASHRAYSCEIRRTA